MDKLDNFIHTTFITFVIIVKVIFVISSIAHLVLTYSINTYHKKEFDPKLVHIKEITETIFTISTALLLIYYFRPKNKRFNEIDPETSLMFFLFGWVIIFTTNWTSFYNNLTSLF